MLRPSFCVSARLPVLPSSVCFFLCHVSLLAFFFFSNSLELVGSDPGVLSSFLARCFHQGPYPMGLLQGDLQRSKSLPRKSRVVSCFSSFSLPWRSWTPSSHGYHSQGCLLPSLCVSMRSSEAPLVVGILEEKVIIKALQEPPGLLEMLMKVIFTPDISLSLSKLGQYSHYSRVYDWALYQPFLRNFTGSCVCHHYFAYNNCTN